MTPTKATPKTALDQMADQEARQLKSLLGDLPVLPRPGKEYDRFLEPRSSEAGADETQEDHPEERPQETKSDETGKDHPRPDEPSAGSTSGARGARRRW